MQEKINPFLGQFSPDANNLPGELSPDEKYLTPQPFIRYSPSGENNKGFTGKKNNSRHPQQKLWQKRRFNLIFWLTLFSLSLGCGGCIFVLDKKDLPKVPNPTVSGVPVVKSLNPTTLERYVHEEVNEYRQRQNLPPLKLDSEIIEVARAHSKSMASGRASFSHDGFDKRVQEIARKVDYQSAGENLAYNFGYTNPGKQAVEGWIKSPGHRKNMEGNFDLTGIGVAQNAKGEYYFTQIFIRQR